ncbi:MAG: PqqD family protein [Pyrinomonadaceae bacterium]
MSISFANQVAVKPDTLINVISGESVLLNLSSDSYFGLDEVGTDMWRHLTAEASIEAAYEKLLAEYEVDAQQLRIDLAAFVEKLVDNKLVELRA